MRNKFVTLFFICTIHSVNSSAQADSSKTISGQTVDFQFQPIPFVCIKISGSEPATYSNPEGKFQLKVLDTDTLEFSATTYKTQKFAVKKLRNDFNYITLLEEVYQLNTVDISAMRWQDFKYDMMHKELTPFEQKILVIKGLKNPYTKLVPVPMIGGPLSLIYELLKKENIRKRKMKRWNNTYEKTYIKIQ